ncbi:MAG: dockerin type I repeat-containing protein, partial [Muribaculaceae bacterium]|nr:dockerin type I repeat-containing protein [Muribaculaceae bacterium]
ALSGYTSSSAVTGDVDGDGTVTAGDITALYNYLLNNDSSAIVNGDQDGDGTITAADITMIYNILLGN